MEQNSELDPELIALARPRPQVPPVFAAAVAILCVYLISILWSDFRYSLSDRTPLDVESAGAFMAQPPEAETLVQLTAMPDRSRPAKVAGDKDSGLRVMPVNGTGAQLWLEVSGKSFFAEPVYNERYVGRLRPLADLAYAEALRDYVGALGVVPLFVDPKTRRALSGEEITPEGTSNTLVTVSKAGQAVLTFAKTDRIQEAAQAEAVLQELAIEVISPKKGANDELFVLLVKAPDGHEKLQEQLAKAGYFGVTATPEYRILQAKWSELQWTEDRLEVAGQSVRPEDVERLAVYVEPSIPAGALVLASDDLPGDYWYVPVLVAGLALMAGLMLWVCGRAIRKARS